VDRLLQSSVAILAAYAVSCGPAVPDYELVTSRSGREVKLEDLSRIERVDGAEAMYVAYRSQVDLADLPALHEEVEDVWQTFRPEVEQQGLRLAVIRASQWEKPGWQRHGRAVQFVVERSPEGEWHARPDDGLTPAGAS
jgi:hypothetical protein